MVQIDLTSFSSILNNLGIIIVRITIFNNQPIKTHNTIGCNDPTRSSILVKNIPVILMNKPSLNLIEYHDRVCVYGVKSRRSLTVDVGLVDINLDWS